jgi:integrase
MFRYTILALNTWARPEAILDLNVETQVDFRLGLIDLNPPGRPQVKNKFRPIIRLTENLRGWLLYWNETKPLNRAKKGLTVPVQSVSAQNFELPCKRAEIPRITPYTLRHYMPTRVRRLPDPPPREERSTWMGHVDPKHRTTEEWYESFDPYYLAKTAKAVDQVMLALDVFTGKRLFSPNSLPGTGLAVVGKPSDDRGLDEKTG